MLRDGRALGKRGEGGGFWERGRNGGRVGVMDRQYGDMTMK